MRGDGVTSMSTSTAGNDRWRRTSTWLAHRAPWVLFTVLGAVIAHDLFDSSSSLVFMAELVMVLLGWVTIVISGRHEMKLCERCAAAIPLDPTAAAIRYRWALWLHHRRGRFFLATLTVCMVLWFLSISRVLSDIAAYGPLMVIYRAGLRHRPLVRGCPECRGWRGDGGAGPPAVTPDPLPVGQKTR